MSRQYYDDRREKMIEMRTNGAKLQDIAVEFNMSRQGVQQFLKSGRDYTITNETCVYPNVRKFLNDNHITISDFGIEVFGYRCGYIVYNALSGKTNPRKDTIDKMLKVSGLTYEEFFERD